MTDLYDQLYEEFLTDQEIDDDLVDNELSDDDELSDDYELPDDNAVNITRHERFQPSIKIIESPTEDSLPKITDESIKLAEYFRLRSKEMPIGDILCKIRNDGLEPVRLDLTSIMIHWFPGIKAKWISLQCIGASNYCVSSLGDICQMRMRRLLELGNLSYAFTIIKLDSGVRIRMALHNLIAAAFWEYPKNFSMTVDHRNRSSRDNTKDNLSWESKKTQSLNQRKRKNGIKRIPVNQIDPVDRKVIKEWKSTNEIAEHFKVPYDVVGNAIFYSRLFNNSFWEYHEPFLDGEEFRSIPIDGLDDYHISNKGRCMLKNGHITDGSFNISGYRRTNLINTLTGTKPYLLHILVAMAFVPNDRPERKIVNHKDHVRHNNCYTNLEWATISENNKHANLLRRRVRYVDEKGQRYEFSSVPEASNKTNIPYKIIIWECRKSKLGKGSKFSYIDHDVKVFGGTGTPIVQCNLVTGSKLFVWEHATTAQIHTGILSYAMRDVLKGRVTSAGGFFWRLPTILEAPEDITKVDISTLKYRGLSIRTDNIVQIYQLDNKLVINKYQDIEDASQSLGLIRDIITDIVKFRRNGYDFGDGEIHWFLYHEDYEKRIKNNEPLIQPIKFPDFKDKPIIILSLEGDYITERPSAKEAVPYLRERVVCRSNFGASNIIKVARGQGKTLYGYRFAFAEDYHLNPNSYKENLDVSILKAIKKSRN